MEPQNLIRITLYSRCVYIFYIYLNTIKYNKNKIKIEIKNKGNSLPVEKTEMLKLR